MRCGFYAGNSKALLCLWIRLSHDSENLKGTASSSCSGRLSGTHAGDWKKEKKGVIFSRDTLYHLIYCWDYRQLKGGKKKTHQGIWICSSPSCGSFLLWSLVLSETCCFSVRSLLPWKRNRKTVVNNWPACVYVCLSLCCRRDKIYTDLLWFFFFFELLAPFSVINHVMAKQIWEVMLLYLLKLFFLISKQQNENWEGGY